MSPPISTRSAPRLLLRQGMLILGLALAGMSGGCGGEAGLPAGGAPVVSPDSDAAKKAIAENEAQIKKNQEQEAKAFRRMRKAPDKIEGEG